MFPSELLRPHWAFSSDHCRLTGEHGACRISLFSDSYDLYDFNSPAMIDTLFAAQ